jgi:hypothetical protein
MNVEFRTVAHAEEAWNSLKTVLNDYSVGPALTGRIMEAMTDLAISIDKSYGRSTDGLSKAKGDDESVGSSVGAVE